jgi:hypothetical protein
VQSPQRIREVLDVVVHGERPRLPDVALDELGHQHAGVDVQHAGCESVFGGERLDRRFAGA